MPADEYGRSLKGLGINIIVADIDRAVAFQTQVLGADVVYADADFAARFGCTLNDAFGSAIERHLGTGLLEWSGGRLRLTARGLLLANEVFVDLLPEIELAAAPR